MSRATTVTKLPLARWAQIMGLHPLHFEQVRLDVNPHCSQLYMQHQWQNSSAISREQIALAIADAEAKIENHLGYRLAPTWEVDEWKEAVRPFSPEKINVYSSDIRGFNTSVRANWGYLISGGIVAKTLIEAGATIVYTDEDGDNYFETATVTVSTVALDKNEIVIYYPGHEGDDTWEIRPINVVISSGVATITFRRELVVIETLLETIVLAEDVGADGYSDDDFLTEVDVYRKYNDPQTQVTMLWEPPAGGYCGNCGGSGCSACAYAVQSGCILLRGDPRQSIIAYHPGVWDSETDSFTYAAPAANRQPDIVRLFYYAGWRDKTSQYVSRMAPEWERVVAYMAAASLDRPPCDCGAETWEYWREDLAFLAAENERNPSIRNSIIVDNPFGTRRGEMEAYRAVARKAIGDIVRV